MPISPTLNFRNTVHLFIIFVSSIFLGNKISPFISILTTALWSTRGLIVTIVLRHLMKDGSHSCSPSWTVMLFCLPSFHMAFPLFWLSSSLSVIYVFMGSGGEKKGESLQETIAMCMVYLLFIGFLDKIYGFYFQQNNKCYSNDRWPFFCTVVRKLSSLLAIWTKTTLTRL